MILCFQMSTVTCYVNASVSLWYLSNGVPFVIADAQRAVIAPQSQ